MRQKRYNIKYSEVCECENTMYKNVWDAARGVVKRNFIG